MKLSFASGSSAVKTDYSVIRYSIDELLQPVFKTVPIVLQVPNSHITSRRKWSRFKMQVQRVNTITPNKIEVVVLEIDRDWSTPTKILVMASLQRLTKFFPNVEIIASPLRRSWQCQEAFNFLRGEKVTIATHYLENELVFSGWALDYPSKRSSEKVLTFEPKKGQSAYVVLWGSYGETFGSYDYGNFLEDFSRKLMQATRHFQLRQIWVEFKNDAGRMDQPLPMSQMLVGSPFEDFLIGAIFHTQLPVTAVPRTKGAKIRPSDHDRNKLMQLWEKEVFLLDGLGVDG